MKRIVLSGGGGMIGANLAAQALAAGYEVLCLVRPGAGPQYHLADHPRLRRAEVGLDAYAQVQIEGRWDTFFHLAWEKTYGAGRGDVDGQWRNVQYTLDAVRLASRLGCQAFIGAGSQAECGPVWEPIGVDAPGNPLSGYGVAKYAAGKLSALLCTQLGLRHNWVRVLSVYGRLDKPYTLISTALAALQKGEPLELTRCEQIWDYLYERDAGAAFLSIGESGVDRRTYPLGSGQGRLLKDYLVELRQVCSSRSELIFGAKEYYPGQPMHLVADLRHLTRDTGWKPAHSFASGVLEILDAQLEDKGK
jgi:nucleoside-diphosphate-sugar epimerase